MLGKPRILSLFPNSFNKFNKHVHSCKILYVVDIEQLHHGCPPVQEIIRSLKMEDYLGVQTDKPGYNYYTFINELFYNQL